MTWREKLIWVLLLVGTTWYAMVAEAQLARSRSSVRGVVHAESHAPVWSVAQAVERALSLVR